MNSFPPITNDYSYNYNSFLPEFIKIHLNSEKSKIGKTIKKKTIGVKKTGPIYAMHRYWTKQPIDVIKEYINYKED